MYSGTKPFGFAHAWAAIRTTTLGVALLALDVTGTSAEGIADRGSIKDDQYTVPFSWTGFYVGGHVGHAWTDADWTFNNNTFFNNAAGDSFSHSPQGAFGGGQIGYNGQVGRWVWGLEGTLGGGDISKTSFSPFFSTDTLSTDIRTLWAITGRLGYTWDRWLAYGKAGYAGGRIELSASTANAEDGVSVHRTETHHG